MLHKKLGPIFAVMVLFLASCGGPSLQQMPSTNTSRMAEVTRPVTATQPLEKAHEVTPREAMTNTPQPTNTSAPTRRSRPSNTPALTSTPRSTNTLTPTPKPVVLKGMGQTATNKFVLPSPLSVARFTHDGQGNFIVTAYRGDNQDLLINAVGVYQGERPLLGEEPVVLDIRADGAWTVEVRPVETADSARFSGKGDAVSGLFDPPATGPWEIRHSGQRNFIVYLHCSGGSDLIQNEIGSVSGSRVIRFPKGPCLWEVRADGAWSLTPREIAREVGVTRAPDVADQDVATPTPTSAPKVIVSDVVNLRSGPGTVYSVIGAAKSGEAYTITAKIPDGTWLEICCVSQSPAWVAASVVTTSGDLAQVNVATEIPPTPETTAPPQVQVPTGWVKYTDPGGRFVTWKPPNWSLSPATGQNAGHTNVDTGQYYLAFFELQDSPIAEGNIFKGSVPIGSAKPVECVSITVPKGNYHVEGTICGGDKNLFEAPNPDRVTDFGVVLLLLEPR